MADKEDTTALKDIVLSGSKTVHWARAPQFSRVDADAPDTYQWSRKVSRSTKNVRIAEWYIECTIAGEKLLEASVEVDPDRRGGRAVLKGTGFTVSQTLIELADSSGVKEIAENFDLDQEIVANMLNGLAMLLSKPFGK